MRSGLLVSWISHRFVSPARTDVGIRNEPTNTDPALPSKPPDSRGIDDRLRSPGPRRAQHRSGRQRLRQLRQYHQVLSLGFPSHLRMLWLRKPDLYIRRTIRNSCPFGGDVIHNGTVSGSSPGSMVPTGFGSLQARAQCNGRSFVALLCGGDEYYQVLRCGCTEE